MDMRKIYYLIILCSLYLTISLSCDLLAFRLITIARYTFSGSALIYGSLYILLDAITRLTSSKMCIKLILIFHFFDFIYTYLLFGANFLPATSTPLILAFQSITALLPGLFWGGIIGSIVAGITEVLIFAFLQNKIKNFLISSFASTTLVILAHNIPTDYFALKHVFPDNYWEIIFANFLINTLSVIIFSSLMTQMLKRIKV